MNVSVLIATYGAEEWKDLAWSRAYPSAIEQVEDVASFHDPEGTIASVRNEMARTASGEWLLFLDADDELAPGYLDAMRATYEQEGADGVPLLLTPAVQKVKRGVLQKRTFFYDTGKSLTDDNWLVVGTLITRDLFWEVGGFSDYPHGFEDWSLWAKAWKAGAKIVKVPKAIYVQHENPNSKHKQGWRDRRWQEETHHRVRAELFPEL
jgi:GT2 family glycosyltransferase